MFGKFMNNYYYGKSGQGDYTPEDLPKTRWQLFMEMLRVRLSALCRLNLLYVLPWLPAMLVIGSMVMSLIQTAEIPFLMSDAYQAVVAAQTTGEGLGEDGSVTFVTGTGDQAQTTTYTPEMVEQIIAFEALSDEEVVLMQAEDTRSALMQCLLLLIPAIFITGPWTAGVSYVTRNWARDEHAFIWSDLKDAMKTNWKEALGLSAITAVLPAVAWMCWTFYGQMAADNWFMVVPQMFTLMAALTWALAVTYAYPLLVTYKMSFGTIIKNSLLLAVGRLPMSVGIRVLHCVPVLLGAAMLLLTGSYWAILALAAWYLLIGFALSRFVTASYTNGQFDKFINARIEGAQVNRGLAEEDDEDYEDEEEEERELKPWENGYASQDK
jgi:uncharacterized membrane protein YesL